jgi:short-subunit dehydrogenase
MNKGKRLVIPGWKNRAGVEMLRVSPRSTVTKIVRKLQEKKNAANDAGKKPATD